MCGGSASCVRRACVFGVVCQGEGEGRGREIQRRKEKNKNKKRFDEMRKNEERKKGSNQVPKVADLDIGLVGISGYFLLACRNWYVLVPWQ